jgi:diacylglycerol kinase (ATP)
VADALFLVNPTSGNGTAGRKWPEIQRLATAAGLQGEVFTSGGRGEIAERAAAAAADGVPRIVIVGGDGTCNEALNGVLRAGHDAPELSVIMLGTGKDFARSHGIPLDLPAAVEVAANGRLAPVDVGRITVQSSEGEREWYFGNVASAGMSGAVARRAEESSKALGGRVSFFFALVRVFSRWQNVEMTVDVGGERREGRMTSVVVANGGRHAGGMRLAPGASVDDGLFDVVVFGDISKADFVANVGKIYRGTHLTHPKIELLRGAAVTVESAEPQPIEADGEQPGMTPARFEVMPSAVRLRVP